MKKNYLIIASVVAVSLLCIFLLKPDKEVLVREELPVEKKQSQPEKEKAEQIVETADIQETERFEYTELVAPSLEESLEEKITKILSVDADHDDWQFEIYELAEHFDKDQLNELLQMSYQQGLDPLAVLAIQEAVMERWFDLDAHEAIYMVDQGVALTESAEVWLHRQIESLTENNPQEALDFISQNKLSNISQDNALFAVARGSAQLGDIQALNTALEQIQDPERRIMTTKSTASYMQQFNPETTDEWIETLPPKEKTYAMAYAAKQQAAADVDAAMQKLEIIRNSDEIDAKTVFGTTSRILAAWGEKEPQQAADWFMKEMKQGRFTQEESEMMLAMVLNVWVTDESSSASAIAWVEQQLETGELDETILNTALQRY